MTPQRYTGILCGIAVALTVALAPALAIGSPPDDDITFWVKVALNGDSHVDAAGIEVTTDDGVVTLSGTAQNLATKQYAVQDAEKINGVIGVVDRVELALGWRPDFDIVQDVRHRIINNEMIATSWITVVSSNGAVTLTGKVGSWAEKQEAGIVAVEVRGVRKVNNEITVKYASNRSAKDIKEDVEAKLDLDTYLNGLPVSVTVKDGVVTLSGTVGNEFERDRAEREVRYLAGVSDVKNDLKVEWWENRGARTSRPKTPSDSELRKRVTSTIERDSRINASKVDVDASHGHVTLTGSVPFMYEKRIAEDDATNTIGVAWVTNDLLVTGVHREDNAILTDVHSNLDSDYLLGGMDIATRVHHGTVTLTGDVATKWERQHAEDLITRVPGVKKIRNHLKVDRNQFSDDALTRRITSRLSRNWITAPVREKIDVNVKGGVVTLIGEVDTWAERTEAAQIALHTPGVWSVHDVLAVHGVPYPWDEWDEEILVFEPYYSIWP